MTEQQLVPMVEDIEENLGEIPYRGNPWMLVYSSEDNVEPLPSVHRRPSCWGPHRSHAHPPQVSPRGRIPDYSLYRMLRKLKTKAGKRRPTPLMTMISSLSHEIEQFFPITRVTFATQTCQLRVSGPAFEQLAVIHSGAHLQQAHKPTDQNHQNKKANRRRTPGKRD